MGDTKAAEQRKARLAKALRDNLKKRKARGILPSERDAPENGGLTPEGSDAAQHRGQVASLNASLND